jgi:subtilisin-like proprotein convertase family protein
MAVVATATCTLGLWAVAGPPSFDGNAAPASKATVNGQMIHVTVEDAQGNFVADVTQLIISTPTMKPVTVMPNPDGTFTTLVRDTQVTITARHAVLGMTTMDVELPAEAFSPVEIRFAAKPAEAFGPGTCGPGAGPCDQSNGSPGCDDVDCCTLVCSFDPFCCDVEWDGICAGEAADVCGAATGACCLADGSCEEVPAALCGGEYQGDGTTCADVECAGVCGPGAGPCDQPNGTPGCENEACCQQICAADPFCCDVEWDFICADAAVASCQFEATGACCLPNGDCVIDTGSNCEIAGGDYQGDNVSCGGDPSGGEQYSDAPGVGIPDNDPGGISVSINVPDSFTIEDLNVSLNITHTFVGDLIATVEHNGATAILVDRPGVPESLFGCGENNFAGATLDDEGTGGALEDLCEANLSSPPNYSPESPLSVFDGMDASGTWTLTVSDNAAADTGGIDAWTLLFNQSVSGGPCIPLGACCFSNGDCEILSEEDCGAAGGDYQGDDTPCFIGGESVYMGAAGLDIPDGDEGGISHTINVPDTFSITDVDVRLNITHTFVGDLCISVTHGDTTVDIVQRPGADTGEPCHFGSPFGCPNNDYNMVQVDDEGTGGSMEDLCGADGPTSPPNYTPNNPLSAFDGMDAAGPWIITVSDNAAADTGTLNGWALVFTGKGEPICPQEIEGSLDIKPGSCPNSYNPGSNGVLPVALVGTDDFDVSQVDISTVTLSRADGVGGSAAPNEGPPGPHTTLEDTATPFDGELCDCHEAEGDGVMDLNFKFRANEMANLGLGDTGPGSHVELVLRGSLLDGTEFVASDCVRIVPNRGGN